MNPEPTPSDNKKVPKPPREFVTEKDHFLQLLVDSTNTHPDNTTDVILQMSGMFVSGTIISGDKYFEKIAEKTSSSEESRKVIVSMGDHYREDRENKIVSDRETTFIHLENCTFHGHLQFRGMNELWRGRISMVEGFMMGRLETKDE